MGGEHSLQDFWAWAFSDLVSNTERGKLAEYLVAKAMGCGTQISQTWESYDLLSPEGIKIEVKTSAYIQSWKQKAFSKISFGIAKTKFWDGLDYVGEKKRHADVYVFCVLKHKDQETLILLIWPSGIFTPWRHVSWIHLWEIKKRFPLVP
ncbi:MAG: hypothetical protein V8Q91_10525 [Bilophila wadsworthia]|uniref:hypothetical protein n=1 Tax=Bilophila wadsworthia TaxID=35833 RepID=UPI00300EDED0